MKELIKIQTIKGVEVVDSRLIALRLGIEHKNLLETIRKQKDKIEERYGFVAFQTERITTVRGEREQVFCLLTESQAIFIAALSRNTEIVIDFKADLVDSFMEARKSKQESVPLLSWEELTIKQLQENIAQRKRIEAIEQQQAVGMAKINEVAAKIETIDTNYYSSTGWYSLHGKKIDTSQARQIGVKCGKMSREMGIPIGKAYDAKYGQINTYHRDILSDVTGFGGNSIAYHFNV